MTGLHFLAFLRHLVRGLSLSWCGSHPSYSRDSKWQWMIIICIIAFILHSMYTSTCTCMCMNLNNIYIIMNTYMYTWVSEECVYMCMPSVQHMAWCTIIIIHVAIPLSPMASASHMHSTWQSRLINSTNYIILASGSRAYWALGLSYVCSWKIVIYVVVGYRIIKYACIWE